MATFKYVRDQTKAQSIWRFSQADFAIWVDLAVRVRPGQVAVLFQQYQGGGLARVVAFS